MAKKTISSRPKSTPKRTTYIVANNHTAAIVFPRSSPVAVRSSPLVLPAGKAIEIDAAEWSEIRKSTGVKNYMDAGLITETNRVGDVPTTSVSSSRLVIPEHLTREGEVGQSTDVVASVRRSHKNTLKMKTGG